MVVLTAELYEELDLEELFCECMDEQEVEEGGGDCSVESSLE